MALVKITDPDFIFTVYTDKIQEWRWEIKAKNGKIVGACTEGFESKRNALNNFKLLAEMMLKWHSQQRDN